MPPCQKAQTSFTHNLVCHKVLIPLIRMFFCNIKKTLCACVCTWSEVCFPRSSKRLKNVFIWAHSRHIDPFIIKRLSHLLENLEGRKRQFIPCFQLERLNWVEMKLDEASIAEDEMEWAKENKLEWLSRWLKDKVDSVFFYKCLGDW